MMQEYEAVPSNDYTTYFDRLKALMAHLNDIRLGETNLGKEFFKYLEEYYDEQSSELVYTNNNLVKVNCYNINDTLIFVANKPFQKKGLTSVAISGNKLIASLIKIGLEKQTGFQLIGSEQWA